MSKIALLQENCWVVRNLPSDGSHPQFWVAANQWTTNPIRATIFPSEDSARRHIDDFRYWGRAGFSQWAVVEAVPLEGAVKSLGTWVSVKEPRPRHP